MIFTIKQSRVPKWGFEITCGDWFHNIAPSAECAINYLKDRYGADVHYLIVHNNGLDASMDTTTIKKG